MNQHKRDASLFKALSDPKRLAVLELLRSGEKCACELIEALNIAQPALSYHMKILCESGLVTVRPEGKWMHYHISEQGAVYAESRLQEILKFQKQMNNGRCREK